MGNLPFNYRRVMVEMNSNHDSFLLVGGLNYLLCGRYSEMNHDSNSASFDDFEREHEKRDKKISSQQSKNWADGLLACLPDSVGYRKKCTPQARLAEQEELNRWVEEWLQRSGQANTDS